METGLTISNGLVGFTSFVAAMSLSFLPRVTAQITQGRNANVFLTTDRDHFVLELVEPRGRARVQYRGAIVRRRGGESTNSGAFTSKLLTNFPNLNGLIFTGAGKRLTIGTECD
jgi:hypothetical protein